jgi:hypothetical protein
VGRRPRQRHGGGPPAADSRERARAGIPGEEVRGASLCLAGNEPLERTPPGSSIIIIIITTTIIIMLYYIIVYDYYFVNFLLRELDLLRQRGRSESCHPGTEFHKEVFDRPER